MILPSHIKNVIFDFGGVLFEIDYYAPVREFKKIGFGDFDKIYTQAAQNEIFDKMETGKMSNEDFYSYVHSFCPGASHQQVVDAWNSILLRLLPEQVRVVERVKEMGYKTFMLSNTNAIHVAEFERMIDETMGLPNFRSVFEKIYYSNEIGIKKPYPETYLEVCSWNGLVPSETAFIDDSQQHVTGAAEAGLYAIHLEPGKLLSDLF